MYGQIKQCTYIFIQILVKTTLMYNQVGFSCMQFIIIMKNNNLNQLILQNKADSKRVN